MHMREPDDKLEWQGEFSSLLLREATRQDASVSLEIKEIENEANEVPECYPRRETGVEEDESSQRRKRHNVEKIDEIASALTYCWVKEFFGQYQNLQEDLRWQMKIFIGMQRFVRSKWAQYKDIPIYKPPTCKTLGERLSQNRDEYEAFFEAFFTDVNNALFVQLFGEINSTQAFVELRKGPNAIRARKRQRREQSLNSSRAPDLDGSENTNVNDDEIQTKLKLYSRWLERDDLDYPTWEIVLAFTSELEKAGKYKVAMPLSTKLVGRSVRMFGENHEHYASSVEVLARLLQAEGNLRAAETRWREVQEIYEKAFRGNEGHPKNVTRYAMALNALAVLLNDLAKFDEAEALLRETLKIWQNQFGKENENEKYATFQGNLAIVLKSQGKLGKALSLLKAARKINEKVLGSDHPNYVKNQVHLAIILRAQGKLEEAEPILRQSLRSIEKTYGTNHLEYASCKANLAVVLEEKEELTEAECLMKDNLRIAENVLEEDHVYIGAHRVNLAAVLLAQRRYSEAAQLIERGMLSLKNSLGKEHPEYSRALNIKARLLQDQNRLDEAEKFLREALRIDEKCLGRMHPSYARNLNNIAMLLLDQVARDCGDRQKKLDEAEEMMKQVVEIEKKTLGEAHHSYTVSLNNLAEVQQKQGKLANADISEGSCYPLIERS